MIGIEVFRQTVAAMLRRRPTRYLVVPVALLALLLVGMTLGSVSGTIIDGSAESACPICHLSHQPIERPAGSESRADAALVAPTPEPRDAGFAPVPRSGEFPPALLPPLKTLVVSCAASRHTDSTSRSVH